MYILSFYFERDFLFVICVLEDVAVFNNVNLRIIKVAYECFLINDWSITAKYKLTALSFRKSGLSFTAI